MTQMSKGRVESTMHEIHERSTELPGGGAHVHQVAAETRDQQDHPTANERSRWQREENFQTQGRMEEAWNWGTNGGASRYFGHQEIAELAHSLWTRRGCPQGSPEVDWFEASVQLRAGRA
jgi:hypothetical protein